MFNARLLLAAQITLAAQVATPVQQAAPLPAPITGYWEGLLRRPGAELPFQVNLAQGSGKELIGHISVPAQLISDFKLDGVAFASPDVTFSMPVPGNPTFKGRLEGNTIKGVLSQGGVNVNFELKRTGDPKTATEVALPKGLREQDITFGKASWELPGTLTLPVGKGPFPAALLVHGSGPNNRDEQIGPSFVFRDIAWGLAEKGFAVFRYDKRTLVHAAKLATVKNFTLNDETVDDAVLAVEAVSKIEEIDATKVFVIGHSIGGYALGRIAEKSPIAAGFVSLAGAARSIADLIAEQSVYLGMPSEMIKSAKDAAALVRSQELNADTPARALPGYMQIASWWLDLRDYDPVATLRRAKRPSLILQGEADYQVPMIDFEMWKKGFPEAIHKSFPKLDHLFMHVEGKSTPQTYALPDRNVDAGVIQAITDWINAQSKSSTAESQGETGNQEVGKSFNERNQK
jgi:pimeloyl-ACP methyl ester carboxylesterase